MDAVEDLISNPPPDPGPVDSTLSLPRQDTLNAENTCLGRANLFNIHDYNVLRYGTFNTLAFKTKVIPTSDGNEDPIFQTTRIEEFNERLDKGIFQVFPCQRSDGHRIYRSRFVD